MANFAKVFREAVMASKRIETENGKKYFKVSLPDRYATLVVPLAEVKSVDDIRERVDAFIEKYQDKYELDEEGMVARKGVQEEPEIDLSLIQ